MIHRTAIWFTLSVCLLAACDVLPAKTPLAATSTPGVTNTPMVIVAPATLTSIPEPVTQTPTAQVPLAVGIPAELEIIQPGNWDRLRLLQILPAEMPLENAALAISPDGNTLAIGTAQLLFFDLNSWRVSRTAIINVGEYFRFQKLEYLSDGTLIASSSGPYRVYHLDAAGKILAEWGGGVFAISADDKTLAIDSEEGVSLVDIARAEPLGVLAGNTVMGLSFSPDGSKLAVSRIVGADSVDVSVWELANRTILATLAQVDNPRFSPDGKSLVVTNYQADTPSLAIFSPDGAAQLATLSAPTGLTTAAPVFSPDGSILVAQMAGASPAPIAWESTTWQPLGMPALQGQIDSFSPDGKILVTRGLDGAILLWGVLP